VTDVTEIDVLLGYSTVTFIQRSFAMKRFAVLSFIIGLLTVPTRAQESLPAAPEGYGLAVVTPQVADCALDLIKFKAAVVMGIDLIEVTEETRQIWRNYLAINYSKLAPADQHEYGPLACPTLDNLRQASPFMRESYRQTWAASLPPVLQFLEPVMRSAPHLRALKQQVRAYEEMRAQKLRDAQELQLRVAEQLRAAEQRRAARQNAAPSNPTPDTEANAMIELQRRYNIGATLLQWWRR
jgi:hypothetical protein